MFSVPGVANTTGVRYATFMRLLCRKNGGTYVGLSRLWTSDPAPSGC